MIKCYYAKDNGSDMLLLTDGTKCVPVDAGSYDEALKMDLSGVEGCETIEEVEVQTSIDAVEFKEEQFETLEFLCKL